MSHEINLTIRHEKFKTFGFGNIIIHGGCGGDVLPRVPIYHLGGSTTAWLTQWSYYDYQCFLGLVEACTEEGEVFHFLIDCEDVYKAYNYGDIQSCYVDLPIIGGEEAYKKLLEKRKNS